MLFTGRRFHKVENSTKVPVNCTNCNNDVEYELFYAKSGPGLSIPITPLFTDKFTVAAKFFYLVCPICTFGFKVNRAQAKGLGA